MANITTRLCTPPSPNLIKNGNWLLPLAVRISEQMLSEKLSVREKEAEDLRESLVRQKAEMSAKHVADTKAATDKAAKELRAAEELHQQKSAALQARCVLSVCWSGGGTDMSAVVVVGGVGAGDGRVLRSSSWPSRSCSCCSKHNLVLSHAHGYVYTRVSKTGWSCRLFRRSASASSWQLGTRRTSASCAGF